MLLRNRLKYALNYKEVKYITMQRLIKVDARTRTDTKYPAGLMDVISMDKSDEHYRLLYDVRGRFNVHRISKEEASYKLARVKKSIECRVQCKDPLGISTLPVDLYQERFMRFMRQIFDETAAPHAPIVGVHLRSGFADWQVRAAPQASAHIRPWWPWSSPPAILAGPHTQRQRSH